MSPVDISVKVTFKGASPCSGLAVKSAVGGLEAAGCNCRVQLIANDNESKIAKRDLCIDCILALITMNLNSLLSTYEFAILFH